MGVNHYSLHQEARAVGQNFIAAPRSDGTHLTTRNEIERSALNAQPARVGREGRVLGVFSPTDVGGGTFGAGLAFTLRAEGRRISGRWVTPDPCKRDNARGALFEDARRGSTCGMRGHTEIGLWKPLVPREGRLDIPFASAPVGSREKKEVPYLQRMNADVDVR